METRKTRDYIPYCFDSNDKAEQALASLKHKYGKEDDETGYNDRIAYIIGATLFVREHASRLMNLNINSFVRSLGGTEV